MEVLHDGKLRKYYQTSGSDSADVMTIRCDGARMRILTVRLVYKTVTTSGGSESFATASNTKTCTVDLKSGKSLANSTTLNTITCVAGMGAWSPTGIETIFKDDQLVLTPQASGTVSVVSALEVTVLVDEIV